MSLPTQSPFHKSKTLLFIPNYKAPYSNANVNNTLNNLYPAPRSQALHLEMRNERETSENVVRFAEDPGGCDGSQRE